MVDESSDDDDYEYAENYGNDSGDEFVLELAAADPMHLPDQHRSTHYHMRPATALTPVPITARRDTVIDLGIGDDTGNDGNERKKRPGSPENGARMKKVQKVHHHTRPGSQTKNATPTAEQPSISDMVDMLEPDDSRSLLVQLARENSDIRDSIYALTHDKFTNHHRESPQPPAREIREGMKHTENTTGWEARATRDYSHNMDQYRINESFRQFIHREHPDLPGWNVPTLPPVRRRRAVSTPPSNFPPPGTFNIQNIDSSGQAYLSSIRANLDDWTYPDTCNPFDDWIYPDTYNPTWPRVPAIQRGWPIEYGPLQYPSPPPERSESLQIEQPAPLLMIGDFGGEGEAPLPDSFQWETSPPPLPRIDVTNEAGKTRELQDIEDEEEKLKLEKKREIEKLADALGAVRDLLNQRLIMRKMRDEMACLEEMERDHSEIYIDAESAQSAVAPVQNWQELVAQMTGNGGATSKQSAAVHVENQWLSPYDRRIKKSSARSKQDAVVKVEDQSQAPLDRTYKDFSVESKQPPAVPIENRFRAPSAQTTAEVDMVPKGSAAGTIQDWREFVTQTAGDLVAASEHQVVTPVSNQQEPVAEQAQEPDTESNPLVDAHPPLTATAKVLVAEETDASSDSSYDPDVSSSDESSC